MEFTSFPQILQYMKKDAMGLTRLIFKRTLIKNKVQLQILIIVATGFYLSSCNQDVSYEEVAFQDAPDEVTMNLHNVPPGQSTGMAEIGNEAYAIIIGDTGQEIEVISVSNDFDIYYRIVETSESNSERPIKIVKMKNNGSPVGFKEVQ